MLDRANNQIRDLSGRINRLEPKNERLREIDRDMGASVGYWEIVALMNCCKRMRKATRK